MDQKVVRTEWNVIIVKAQDTRQEIVGTKKVLVQIQETDLHQKEEIMEGEEEEEVLHQAVQEAATKENVFN